MVIGHQLFVSEWSLGIPATEKDKKASAPLNEKHGKP